MAISLTHTTQAVGTDAGNGEIRKAQWNEAHTLTMATGKLLGRNTAGTGAVEEISLGTNLSMSGTTLDAAGVTQLAALTTTSGTSQEFTIPSTAKRITLSFSSVSTNGTSLIKVQLSTGGSYKTSGYISFSITIGPPSTIGGANKTDGLGLEPTGFASNVMSGIVELVNVTGNVWVYTQVIGYDGILFGGFSGGTVTLSGAIDKIKVTTDGGTDTFDSGYIGCMYL